MNRNARVLTWTELRVGLVVIASLVILALTVLYIGGGGGSPFSEKYEVKALMSDVNGLKPGAPVRVGGVEVGTVTRVDFASGAAGMVEVTMRVDRRVQGRITTESTAQLGALGLLGEKAVDVTAASRGTPVVAGGYLSASQVDPFKSLVTDASDTTGHLKKILSRLDAGEGTLGRALRDEDLYDRMADVAVRLQAVMVKLEGPEGPLGRLVNDRELSAQLGPSVRAVDEVATRVQQGKGPLGALTQDEELARDLKTASAGLADVASRLQRGEGTAGRLLQDQRLYDQLVATSTRLDRLVGRLEGGEGTAGRLMRDPALYENMNAAATDLRQLVADVRREPAKYLRVKLSLF